MTWKLPVIQITRPSWLLFCHRCEDAFEFNMELSRHKPKRAADFMMELLAVDNLDVSCDVDTEEPPFLCRCCVMKLDHYEKSRNRNDSKIKFPRDKGNCHVFVSHDSYVEKEGDCPICSFVLRKSPRKRSQNSSSIPSGHASQSSSR